MKKFLFCAAFFLVGSMTALAQTPPSNSFAEHEFQRQMENERLRREQQEEQAPQIHLQHETSPPLAYPAKETPCQPIKEIQLIGDSAERFQWTLWHVKDAKNRCLGAQGINVVMSRVQNAFIEDGYITTRVLAAPQNLKTGKLILTLIPGRVGKIKFAEGSRDAIHLAALIPIRSGEIFNLRDLEQGLENLRRIPSAKPDIQIAPGEKENESDLIIDWQQEFPIRLSLAADNSGSKNTGRYQGNATLSYDNALGFSDLLYITLGHSLETRKAYGTQNKSFHYSLPIGYNQFSVSLSNFDYRQTVAGYMTDYVYSGDSRNLNFELSRVVNRSAKGKTTLSLSTYFNKSHNFIDGEQIDVQKRRMGGWEAAIQHQQFISLASLDGEFRFHRGTGMFRALRAPEEDFNEGTSRPSILTAQVKAYVPFQIQSQTFRYSGQWRQQWAKSKLISRDRFSIGGRHTVRGYDGEYSLSADSGFVMRNEIAWQFNLLNTNHELFAGYDFGHVYGGFSKYLLGQTLSGTVQGLRGSIKKLHYEAFISEPLSRPAHYPANDFVLGFNLSLSF